MTDPIKSAGGSPIKNAADPITARLDRVRALADAATDGPWGHYAPLGWGKDPIFGATPGDEVATVKRPADWRFIAAARTDVPWMADLIEAMYDAVMEVHQKSPHQRWVGFPRADKQEYYCVADQESWPCATVRAVQDAMEGEE